MTVPHQAEPGNHGEAKRGIVMAAAVTLVAVFVCLVLYLAPPDVPWLEVRTPDFALMGSDFPVTVRLDNPKTGTWLGVDLHWFDESGNYRRYLSGAKALPITAGVDTYRFDIPVPGNRQISRLLGIVYVSASHSWDDRIDGASFSGFDPAPEGMSRVTDPVLDTRPVDTGREKRFVLPRRDSPNVRVFTGILLVFAAMGILAGRGNDRKRNMAGSIPFAFTALWELAVDPLFPQSLFRSLFQSMGLYENRDFAQLALVLALCALAAVSALYFLSRTDSPFRLLSRLGLCLYLLIAVLDLVSFHNIDALFNHAASGIQFRQILKFAGAAMAAAGTLAERFRRQISPI